MREPIRTIVSNVAHDGGAAREDALLDERTGEPLENPKHALWLQATTLQTAPTQAYMGSRIAELTIGLGAALVAAGTGVTAAAGSRR